MQMFSDTIEFDIPPENPEVRRFPYGFIALMDGYFEKSVVRQIINETRNIRTTTVKFELRCMWRWLFRIRIRNFIKHSGNLTACVNMCLLHRNLFHRGELGAISNHGQT